MSAPTKEELLSLFAAELAAAREAGDEARLARLTRTLNAFLGKSATKTTTASRRTLTRKEHRAIDVRMIGDLPVTYASSRARELDRKMGLEESDAAPRVIGNRLILGRAS